MFSDKTKSSEKITLAEDDNFFTRDAENTEILNIFLSNPVKSLKIPEFKDVNAFAEKIYDLILKAIFKYSKQPQVSLLF